MKLQVQRPPMNGAKSGAEGKGGPGDCSEYLPVHERLSLLLRHKMQFQDFGFLYQRIARGGLIFNV